MKRRLTWLTGCRSVLFLFVVGLGAFLSGGAEARSKAEERYPYGGPVFTGFIADSYQLHQGGSPHGFYRWMDSRRIGGSGTWGDRIRTLREERRTASSTKRRTEMEIAAAADFHRAVKRAIPRFSLERGFEFAFTVRYGERQCFLQSVLLAGLLQAAGIDAGVVMVYRNAQGEESNNGHAVTLVKLSDGRDAVLDASEMHPFHAHRGLFVFEAHSNDYRFVQPVYNSAGAEGARILRYSHAGRTVTVSRVRPLPVAFLRSQFAFYRGERQPGGPLAKKPTGEGLAASERHLRAANRLCVSNPLALFWLGQVCEIRGDHEAAARARTLARRLYVRQGWVPGALR